jgi:hypothetical protein
VSGLPTVDNGEVPTLDEAAAPLLARQSALQAQRASLRAALAKVDGDLRAVERAAGILLGEDRTVRPMREKRTAKRALVSDARVADLADHLRKVHPDSGFTIPTLSDELGWNRATTGIAVQYLRDRGVVRRSGKQGIAYLYRLTPSGKEG